MTADQKLRYKFNRAVCFRVPQLARQNRASSRYVGMPFSHSTLGAPGPIMLRPLASQPASQPNVTKLVRCRHSGKEKSQAAPLVGKGR